MLMRVVSFYPKRFCWTFNFERSSYCLRKSRRQKAHHSLSMSIPEKLNWQLFLIKLKMKNLFIAFSVGYVWKWVYQHLSSSETRADSI